MDQFYFQFLHIKKSVLAELPAYQNTKNEIVKNETVFSNTSILDSMTSNEPQLYDYKQPFSTHEIQILLPTTFHNLVFSLKTAHLGIGSITGGEHIVNAFFSTVLVWISKYQYSTCV